MALHPAKIIAVAVVCLPLATAAQDSLHGQSKAPYAGYEARDIKSLSEQDIAALRRGGGWGLALPAELNGHPGPAHLLELREELGLSSKQVELITEMYEEMRAAAIAAGERFISAEAALSGAFAGPDLTEATLDGLLTEAAEARAALRFIHLSLHLRTPGLLTEAQVQRYAVLRGYADDPCENVPEGHDPDRWRRHNGCG